MTKLNSLNNLLEYRYMGALKKGAARILASDQFEAAYQKGKKRQFLNKILRRDNRLLTVDEAMARSGAKTIEQARIQNVDIRKIRGSESREGDFDADFYPKQRAVKNRWINIAIAKQSDVALPPVELIQIEDTYFVRDGHHRISVARWLGEQEVDAQVRIMHA